MEEGRVKEVSVRVAFPISPGPAICVFPLGSQKRGRLVGALLRDASKLQVPLQHLSNIVLLSIWVLVPLWTVTNPARSHSVVRENEKPLLFSRVDCHSCYFVSNFGHCSASSYLLLFSVIGVVKLFRFF